MTRTGGASELGEALRLVFQVLDLSRDVERNKEDSAFCDDGGMISYVFDASLFEIFVNPRDWRGAMTSLHADMWCVTGAAPSAWRPYGAQTALATMEYLMDGQLPGQDRGVIHMSERHRWELRWRVGALRDVHLAALKRAEPKAVEARLERIRTAQRIDAASDALTARLDDRLLASDLRLFAAAGATEEERKTYLMTRLCMDVLAADRIFEPIEQLRRLVTEPFRTRVRTLHLDPAYAPSEEDWVGIHTDTRAWFDALVRECAIKGVKIVRPPSSEESEAGDRHDDPTERARQRSEGALRDDARTLALVRWAARRATAGDGDGALADPPDRAVPRRLVFVTADDVVFDAYRRWYANLDPKAPDYADGFVLRRITQFTPLINLIDSGLVRGERYRELFKDLLSVLETMLLPLNLSRLSSRTPEKVLTRMREEMALRLTSGVPIEDDLAYAPLVQALRREGPGKFLGELGALLDQLRELERGALAQCDAMVERRVRTLEAELLGPSPDSYDTSIAFANYFAKIVDDLRSSSTIMALPIAIDFINGWRPPHAGTMARAPVALRLTLALGDDVIEVGDLLTDRVAGRFEGPLIADAARETVNAQPGLVFAIASAQCVTSSDWSNAQHFAEVALLAEQEQHPSRAVFSASDRGGEVLYLNALVRRFRLGEIGPASSADKLRRIERHYEAALAMLNTCAEPTARTAARPLRSMRTLSERAALHLFYASALNRLVGEAIRPRLDALDRSPGDPLETRGVEALVKAEQDLRGCLALDRELPESEIDQEPRRRTFLATLRRQFTTNIAAAAVLRSLFEGARTGSQPELWPSNPDVCGRIAGLLESAGRRGHPVMQADLLGFLAMAGDADAESRLGALRWPEDRPGLLALDRGVFLAVRTRLGRRDHKASPIRLTGYAS